jgi:hypothetical protein
LLLLTLQKLHFKGFGFMEIEVCIDGIWYEQDKETQTASIVSYDNEK